MRLLLAAFLLIHGIAHLPGFLVDWQLRSLPELPYRTTIFAGSVEVGTAGIRAIGLAWLLAAVAFALAALGLVMRWGSWQSVAYTAIAASVFLTVAAWPEARLGLFANVVLMLLILVGQRVQWL
ncbi:MAG TPA: hypothetical protein VJP86_10930 [Vicinamibacterales bacterium]|jgi:hypothetical protein|nr:hypothetical protein [Vicinamibacterales bacterium]